MGFEAVGSLRTSSNGLCSSSALAHLPPLDSAPCETALGWPHHPVSSLLLLPARGMPAWFTLWKQSCPTRSSPTACGGTSHPTVCSDLLTHAHRNASAWASSGASSCCDKVGSSRGQCPPPEMPTTAAGWLPEERGWVGGRAGWGEQCFSRESCGTEKAITQGVGGCRGSPSSLSESCSQLSHVWELIKELLKLCQQGAVVLCTSCTDG